MNDSATTLHPPWLNVARAAWIVCAVGVVVIFAFGFFSTLDTLYPPCTEQGVTCAPWTVSAEDLALARQMGLPVELMQFAYLFNSLFPKIAFVLVGAVIFWRRSDDWMALLLALVLMGFALEGLQPPGALIFAQALLYAIISGIFFLLPFIFPNGRWVPRWIRWLAIPLAISAGIPSLVPVLNVPLSTKVFGIALLVPFAIWFFAAGYAALYRYRRVSNALERQQTKWVMAGLLGTFVIFLPFTIISIFFPPTQPSPERLAVFFLFYLPVAFLGYLFIPVSIAISILRYRLWDIDILIRRTVSYAIIVALLAMVYFGSVIVLQRIFAGIIGDNSEIITVLSTLAIAALFVPLRNKIQDAIDKRFNRKKYDAQKVLEKFGETVRDETDLDTLTAELVKVVNETMQPKSVSLWLKREGGRGKDEG